MDSKPAHYYQGIRSEMMLLLPKQYSSVLEIGCGEGGFRDNLNQEHQYWGVEPIKSAAEIAAKKLDKVLVGTYEELYNQLPNDYFDLVICNDVIEHMVDHDRFLQAIKSKIKKGGCLIASVPNVRYVGNLFEILVKKDWEYKDQGILDQTHLRFFTEKSLKRTITNNGFSIDQFIGINSFDPERFMQHRMQANYTFLVRSIYGLAILLLGQDIKFLQFGIRIIDT